MGGGGGGGAFSMLALSQKKGPFPTGTRVQNNNNKSGVLF